MAAGAGMIPFAGLAAAAAAQQAETTTDAATGHDALFASCLLIVGRKQIEVCRFALDRIQHEDVKAFAQAEIDEHETLKTRLEGLGYRYPAAATAGAAGDGAGRGRGVVLSVRRATLPPGASDLIAVDHEVAEQCIATTKAEQGKLQGLKFDERFVGSQLDAHYGLLDKGVVFRKHASSELAPVLDEARPIIERHIATCKALMEALEAKKREG
jgi:predicted outer membrane protein